MSDIKVDRDRLWTSLMKLGEIGATPRGGVCRLALTDRDRMGRDLFVEWCKEAGCKVSVDGMGNIFARRAGRNDDLPPVMTGSHLDSQPTGGKFDGAYGVLAGLEVIRALNDHDIETDAPIEVVAWTNEEGVRFSPPMIGSGVFTGVFDLDYGLSRSDSEGKTMGDELRRIGYAGKAKTGGREIGSFFEAHIEQGPILEEERKTIGVVERVQGMRWYETTVGGMEGHAGTTPLKNRHDALVGAARMVGEAYRVAHEGQPEARVTVGHMEVRPNSPNTIPGEVFFTVDVRHPDEETLSEIDAELRRAFGVVADEFGLELDLKQTWKSPPVIFAEECVGAVRRAAERLGLPFRDMVSGAGHDACHVSRIAPTGMVFVPCEKGISHNETENATPDDLAAGCAVLLHAMLERATAD